METDQIRCAIAENIAELRKQNGMTQLELAEALNYTDKAISKWERAESVPDIYILKRIADLFGVSVDYLLTTEHEAPAAPEAVIAPPRQRKIRRRAMITGIAILLCWLIATALFSLGVMLPDDYDGLWLAFIYAVPASALVWLVLNSIWFNRRRNYLIISILLWTLLTAIHLSCLVLGKNVWPLYLLGIPGQIMILLWSGMGRRSKKM